MYLIFDSRVSIENSQEVSTNEKRYIVRKGSAGKQTLWIPVETTLVSEGFIAQGELTIRDVTKSIALPFKVSGPIKDARGNTRIGVKAQTIINRQEYNITWNKTLDNGGLVVSDEVEVIINIEFIKQ